MVKEPPASIVTPVVCTIINESVLLAPSEVDAARPVENGLESLAEAIRDTTALMFAVADLDIKATT